ncbi:MAG: ribosome maturation factor RimM [Chloroflexota bacterium]
MTSEKRSFSKKKNSGSLSFSEPEFLVVGKLRRPHGLRGEVLMSVWTDFPERLQPGVSINIGVNHDLYTIRSIRWHRQDMLIAFEGILDRDQAGIFRNQLIMVRADDRPPLPEGEVYQHQLLGMRVILDEDDSFLGTLTEIIETGANDVYLVRAEDGQELLIPAIDSVILKTDIEAKEIFVKLLPGLLPDS